MEIEDLFYYDVSSPSGLRWKVDRFCGKDYNRKSAHKDSIAGSLNTESGYWMVAFNKKLRRVHRIVYELAYGKIKGGFYIDHIDGVRSNNELHNLRLVTPQKNSRNNSKRLDNKTGVNGVSLFCNTQGYLYYVADARGLNKERIRKFFSVLKMGDKKAFDEACAYRQSIIDTLNSQGAGYSEDHGKREVL